MISQNSWRLQRFYYTSLCLYLAVLFLNQTEVRVLLPDIGKLCLKGARYFCYVCFITKILLTPVYQKRYVALVLASATCLIASVVFAERNAFFLFFLVFVASYNCDTKTIMRCVFWVFSIGLGLTLLLILFGILNDTIMDTDRNRHNLGFNWVTLAPIYFMFISICYVNLRDNKITLLEFFSLWICSALLFNATDTRLTFYLSSLFLFVAAINHARKEKGWALLKRAGVWICLLPFVICFLVFLVHMFYDAENSIWVSADQLLSGRLHLADNSLRSLAITPFGQKVEWVGLSLEQTVLQTQKDMAYNCVDCGYLRIFFDYGYLGLFIVLGLYSWGMYKAAKKKAGLLLFSYCTVLVFCITEQWIIELSFNPFLLIAGAELMDDTKPMNSTLTGRITFNSWKNGELIA